METIKKPPSLNVLEGSLIFGPRVGINILIYPIVLTKFIKIKKLKGTH